MSIKDNRILITGGAGFIGSGLAVKLSEHANVTVYDNFHEQVHKGNPENRDRLVEHNIPIIVGDICDSVAVHEAVKAVDPQIIYHFAAETGTGQSFDIVAQYNDVNVMGTAHLIEAVRKEGRNVSRVILAGSRSVYGEGACVDADGNVALAVERLGADLSAKDFEPKDAAGRTLTPVPTDASCVVAPASVYASTKLMQEYLLNQSFWGTDIEVGILRLQNVYGPGQSLNNPYTGVLSIFTRQISDGKTLNIYEDGEITRDFVTVSDVVEAFYAMATVDQVPQEIIDIGSGEATSVLDVAQKLLVLMNESPEKTQITGDFRPGDIRYAVADISKAKELLGWTPQHKIDSGLRSLVDWSKNTLEI